MSEVEETLLLLLCNVSNAWRRVQVGRGGRWRLLQEQRGLWAIPGSPGAAVLEPEEPAIPFPPGGQRNASDIGLCCSGTCCQELPRFLVLI